MPKSRPYDLVIFDFDDTILHLDVSWKAVKADVVTLAKSNGIKADPKEHLVPMSNRLSRGSGLKKGIDAIYLRFESECAKSHAFRTFPEMSALIKDLRKEGYYLAVASGNHSKTIRDILGQAGLLEEFDIVCGRDSVENNKPAPDQVQLILRHLDMGKGQAVFIGDSINDEGAAKAAGVRYIRAKPGEDGKAAELLRKALLG
ncbi:MAG: HAD hydrolase-like protein [Candidatus Micrarchaeota archaeon]